MAVFALLALFLWWGLRPGPKPRPAPPGPPIAREALKPAPEKAKAPVPKPPPPAVVAKPAPPAPPPTTTLPPPPPTTEPSRPPPPATEPARPTARAPVPPPIREASIAPVKPPRPPEPRPGPRVAIVIDDFGANLEAARKFLALPIPITFSVLPHLSHSREVARMAHEAGREVILHLPMEPRGYPQVNPGPGAVLVAMAPEAIAREMASDLDSVPYAVGLNNHMGSRLTTDRGAMRTVLAEADRRGLAFLDSYTSPDSLGFSLATEMGLPAARRDIFLDHVATEDFVHTQIGHLIERARAQGAAIAIGHPHETTLRVLAREHQRFAEAGVAVVALSEVLARPARP